MTTQTTKIQTLSFLLSLAAVPGAFGFECRPEALREIVADARAAVQRERPVVLFDLDDTLLDTRRRTHRILLEIAGEAAYRAEFPEAAAKLGTLAYEQVHYVLADTFNAIGLADRGALERTSGLWAARFFSNAYAATDTPIEGAVDYVRELRAAGADLVYLTGRDEPRMGEGTRREPVRSEFPFGEAGIRLVLKPTAKTDDLEFKRSVFASVRAMGTVVAAFENEPANLNAMAAEFPGSTPVFLDTIHSPKPDQPGAHTAAVRNYTLNGGCSR